MFAFCHLFCFGFGWSCVMYAFLFMLMLMFFCTSFNIASRAAITGDGSEVTQECGICLSDVTTSHCTALACGHWFCNECLTGETKTEREN